MFEGEVWKDIKGYEGQYQVSNKGNIYSVDRKDSQGKKCGGRMLRPGCHIDGYLQVNLYKNGIAKRKPIHRLVAEAFIPNTNGFPQVNHRDEDKVNNNVENLEWCTSKYNNNHGTRIERTSKKIRAVNVKNGEVFTFSSTVEARRNGYNSGAVSQACRGIYRNSNGKLIGDGRTYKGYKWYYVEEGE